MPNLGLTFGSHGWLTMGNKNIERAHPFPSNEKQLYKTFSVSVS